MTGRYDPAGRAARIGIGVSGYSATSTGFTAFHEVLHLFGLSDRYDRITKMPNKGYENDAMAVGGNTPESQITMSRIIGTIGVAIS